LLFKNPVVKADYRYELAYESNVKSKVSEALSSIFWAINRRLEAKYGFSIISQTPTDELENYIYDMIRDEIFKNAKEAEGKDVYFFVYEMEHNGRKYLVTNATLYWLERYELRSEGDLFKMVYYGGSLLVVDLETGNAYSINPYSATLGFASLYDYPFEATYINNWTKFKDIFKEYLKKKSPDNIHRILDEVVDEVFNDLDPSSHYNVKHVLGLWTLDESVADEVEKLIKQYIDQEALNPWYVNYSSLAKVMLACGYRPEDAVKLLEKQALAVKEERGRKYYLLVLNKERLSDLYVVAYDPEAGDFKEVAVLPRVLTYRGKSRLDSFVKVFKELDIESYIKYLKILTYLDPSRLANDVFELVSNPKVVVPRIMLCKHKDTVLVVVLNDRFEHAILYRNGDVVITRAYNILNRTIDYIMRNPTMYITDYEAELIDTVMTNLLRYDEFPNELADKLTELYVEAKLS